MCGIAGIILFDSTIAQIDISHIQKMTSIIRHRGPDDEGYAFFFKDDEKNPIIFGGVDTPQEIFKTEYPYTPHEQISDRADIRSLKIVLAHRRLSILDLSAAGHQPICYDNRRYWITYNGEIYNWIELRHELENLGHTFFSHTDSEVILAAYAQWGKECLHRFNGMWAFILFDRQTGTLFIARDRYGVKPLYYWVSPEGFLAFASEVKQFTVLPGWRAILNNERASDYLISGRMDHTAETLFKGVFQVRGGQAIHCRLEDISRKLPIFQWYELKSRSYKGTFNEASDELRELLTDSVRLRLRADVPVGSCLSGGLDSSSIVCLVNSILGIEKIDDHQKTFSACSEVKKFDEREYIEIVVKDRKIDAYYTHPSIKVLCDNLDDIIWHQDEPFGSTSIYAQWQVFQLASQNNVKVMLDGQGADEELCGYYSFFVARYVDLLTVFKWGTLLHEINCVRKTHGFSSVINSISGKSIHILPLKWKFFLLRYMNKKLFCPFWLNSEKIKMPLEIPGFQDMITSSFIKKKSHSQLVNTSLPSLLHWEDRDSMAHSVESRVPFLDYRLVEFIYNLPDEFKIGDGITKKILRRSMNGILPEKIQTRIDKMGFVTAEEFWVTKENPILFQQMLKESIELSQGIIKNDASVLLNNMIVGKLRYSFTIWRLICFGKWMKVFNVDMEN